MSVTRAGIARGFAAILWRLQGGVHGTPVAWHFAALITRGITSRVQVIASFLFTEVAGRSLFAVPVHARFLCTPPHAYRRQGRERKVSGFQGCW